MEIFGISLAFVAALSVIVLGLVEWFKTPFMPSWAVRLVSLAISFAIVGLTLLVNPMTWQLFVVNSAVVFFIANGIWHTSSEVGASVAKSIT